MSSPAVKHYDRTVRTRALATSHYAREALKSCQDRDKGLIRTDLASLSLALAKGTNQEIINRTTSLVDSITFATERTPCQSSASR